MANAVQKIRRVNVIPGTLEADTMYVVKAAGASEASLVFTGSDPTVSAQTLDRISVNQIVADAVATGTSIYFHPTYQAMVANAPRANALIYVADASGDPTAVTASRVYLFNRATMTFMGFPNSGGSSTTVTWDAILGRPTATPAQIDQAVANSHTHANKTVLDQISENGQQKLTFRGLAVDLPPEVTFASNW